MTDERLQGVRIDETMRQVLMDAPRFWCWPRLPTRNERVRAVAYHRAFMLASEHGLLDVVESDLRDDVDEVLALARKLIPDLQDSRHDIDKRTVYQLSLTELGQIALRRCSPDAAAPFSGDSDQARLELGWRRLFHLGRLAWLQDEADHNPIARLSYLAALTVGKADAAGSDTGLMDELARIALLASTLEARNAGKR